MPAQSGRNDSSEPDSAAQPTQLIDDTHPATNSILDTQQAYDESTGGAAEIAEPNAGNSVVGYADTATDNDA
jgi:hypothetical protein